MIRKNIYKIFKKMYLIISISKKQYMYKYNNSNAYRNSEEENKMK